MTGDTVQGSFSLILTLLRGSASAAVGEGYPGLLHEIGCTRVLVLLEPLWLSGSNREAALPAWLTPRPRGRAVAGATGINLGRSSQMAVEQTL